MVLTCEDGSGIFVRWASEASIVIVCETVIATKSFDQFWWNFANTIQSAKSRASLFVIGQNRFNRFKMFLNSFKIFLEQYVLNSFFFKLITRSYFTTIQDWLSLDSKLTNYKLLFVFFLGRWNDCRLWWSVFGHPVMTHLSRGRLTIVA